MFSYLRVNECNGQIERNNNKMEYLRGISDVEYRTKTIEKLESENAKLSEQINHYKENVYMKDPLMETKIKKQKNRSKFIKMPTVMSKSNLMKKQKSFHSFNSFQPTHFSESFLTNQYKKFLSIGDTLPEYIRNNLENLPNNRGYIWKNIWCFGKRKSDCDVLYLTEPKKGFVYIHEIFFDKHMIYMKRGRDALQLVESFSRNKK